MPIRSISDLCEKYGFDRLVQLRNTFWTLPDALPNRYGLQTLSGKLGLPETEVKTMLSEVSSYAPSLLDKPVDGSRTYFLCPPTTVCLLGCGYTQSSENRKLVAHRDAVKVKVYDLDNGPQAGFEYTLRCGACKSRYSYTMYFDNGTRAYYLYGDERELLFVNQKVYWTRRTAVLLMNSILHAQCTFQGFAEILRTTFGWDNSFERRTVSEAFFSGEVEAEVRARELNYAFPGRKLNCKGIKDLVEKLRQEEIYHHDCGARGTQRDCPYLHVMDGVWKICFRHCQMVISFIFMPNDININFVNLPPVCENQPKPGCLFCEDHLEKAREMKLPLTKKAVLERDKAGIKLTTCSTSKNLFEEEMLATSTEVIVSQQQEAGKTFSCGNKVTVAPWCKKDLGHRKKVGSWSRGLFVFVHGCGHISFFHPLYRSESMSQVFVIVMEWLFKRLREIPVLDWPKFFLAYDNMCNFAKLKALREPLPAIFTGEYQNMWWTINKVIDSLHLQNHKESCKTDFNPKRFEEVHPEVKETNTMAAEQTFSWMTKYKKQMNAMTKINQLFFLHCLVTRRNAYNESCLRTGNVPLANGPRNIFQRAGLS